MLDGFVVQKCIKLDGLVSCGSILVLRRVFSDPEVDVKFQIVLTRLDVRLKDTHGEMKCAIYDIVWQRGN